MFRRCLRALAAACSTREDVGSTIIEFDEAGHVIRIPGVYPAPTRAVIGVDKLYHFGVGLVVTFIVGAALHPWLGLLACAVVAVGKEFYDKRHTVGHTPDGWDAYATLVGAVPALPLLAWVMRG